MRNRGEERRNKKEKKNLGGQTLLFSGYTTRGMGGGLRACLYRGPFVKLTTTTASLLFPEKKKENSKYFPEFQNGYFRARWVSLDFRQLSQKRVFFAKPDELFHAHTKEKPGQTPKPRLHLDYFH